MQSGVGASSSSASSPEELRALVGAVCRVLELSGPGQVLPAVEAMRAAMEAIPPLEAFVKDACAFLARETLPGGVHLSPEEALRRMDLPGAQGALRAWAKEVRAAARLRRFQSRLRTIVSTREEDDGEGGQDGEDAGVLVLDDEQLLATVAGLVALEHDTRRSEGARAAAESYVAGRPELLVNRAVQHFRYLFQVKGLEGVLPKMNELYLFAAEMGSLTRALRAALGLSPTCPANKLLAELQSLIRRARKAAAAGRAQLEGGEEEDEEVGGGAGEEASLLMTDLNLSTVEEESDESEEEEEEGSEEEEAEEGQPSENFAPSISLASEAASSMDRTEEVNEPEQPPPQQRQRRQQPPAAKAGSSSSGGGGGGGSSSQQHPMLAVLSAAESQESPFLPAPARRRPPGPGVPESPALFVVSGKFGATATTAATPGGNNSSSSSIGGGGGSEDGRGWRPGLEDSTNSSSRYAPPAHGRSSGGSGYAGGDSSRGSSSFGLLGVLSAAESGGSLPSPAPRLGGDSHSMLSRSSDGGGVQ